MRKEPRLHFTKEEREDPALEKPIRKADRAAARADKAQAKVPKQKVKQRTVDPETGAVTVRLQFEDKKPPSKLIHALRDAPADTVLGAVHREIGEAQEDNVGVEAAHKSEQAAETAGRLVREGYHSHKLRPYRKAAAAERKLEKANVNALYQKSLRENPQLASNPLSRWQQKQAIKRQYAAARRAGQTAATVGQATTRTAQSAKAAAKKSRQAADFARRHKKGFLIAAGLFLRVVERVLGRIGAVSGRRVLPQLHVLLFRAGAGRHVRRCRHHLSLHGRGHAGRGGRLRRDGGGAASLPGQLRGQPRL